MKRLAFDTVGGFNEKFKSAGDDVDFCWRLLGSGFKIGFHSSAFVWHHRRPNFASYIRQQAGYGRAEGMMHSLHPEKFGGAIGMRWRGCIYLGPQLSFNRSDQTVYHGPFGHERFQSAKPEDQNGTSSVFTHVAWLFSIFTVAC